MRTGIHACEEAFDRQTSYKRAQRESFAYCHGVKNGIVADLRGQARARVAQETRRREEQL
ncbi:hypothetical protein BH24BAC1_BH24BAC1_24630 [soil metagenome]